MLHAGTQVGGGGHVTTTTAPQLRAQADAHSAHNYHPLPVVIATAEGAWVTDVDGRRYLDMLAAYSAINFGHRHPRLVAAAQRQLERVTLVSRAFEHDQFGPFCAELAALAGMDMVLPMNTGAEAVETAIKTARKWGYEVKGVPDGEAVIIAFDGNFHGRTTTIISFSTDPDARASYGPYTPGFRVVPYGDLDALRRRHGRATWWPCWSSRSRARPGCSCRRPASWPGSARLCTENGALMIADEIQSGLGRTGTTFACEHDDVVPDMYILGKALGGGIVPVSAVVASARCSACSSPASTAPRSAATRWPARWPARSSRCCRTGEFQERSAKLGAHMHDRLAALPESAVREVRGRGLWAGVEFAEPDRARGAASGWPSAACWPRTPTAPRSGWPRR